MNSVASEPALIGIDWGTSSLRAFLIGAQGEVLDRVFSTQGILNVEDGNFEATFRDLVKGWLEKDKLPIIASGMITSRNGWLETPYISVPAGSAELAAALVPLEVQSGVTINFITGLTIDHEGAPDVMRGEETQIIGASATGLDDGVFVMPGTHSKWVNIKNGIIEKYSTFMTGEVFGALRKHTILGALMTEGPFHEAGFRMGVTAGLENGEELLRKLFYVRTLPLFERISSDMVEDYLSGMLIGTEISCMWQSILNEKVIIVGNSDLSKRYEMALDVTMIRCERAEEDIVAGGHFQIAKAAGLLS